MAYYGPANVLRTSEADFPFSELELTYREEFTPWALRLDFVNEADVRRFVNWVARIWMGEDLGDELVKFGYYLDHLICDCNDEKAAIAYAKDNLPSLKPHLAQSAYELLAFVPELASSNDGRVEKP